MGYSTNLTMDQLCERMKAAAVKIAQQSGAGVLHIFIADGNCDDEALEYCLAQPDITAQEREFLRYMLEEIGEEERFGAWALAQCTDATPRSSSTGWGRTVHFEG